MEGQDGQSGQAQSEERLLENPLGCFFIYDEYHEEETADPDDFMLFCYPEVLNGKRVTNEMKYYLPGVCSALINFAHNFAKSSSQVVTLKKTRLAFKQIPFKKVTLVLGSCTVDENTLVAQLEALYKAFCFYNGSFADVYEQHRRLNRKELVAQFRSIGSFLVPQLRSFAKNIMAAFDPLPYTELSADSQCFLKASQILNRLRVDSLNIAGCILHFTGKKKTVLCTHLDTDTTRWVSNLVHLMICKNVKKNKRRRTTDQPPIEHVDETSRSFYHPFLTNETLQSLHKELKPPLPPLQDPVTDSPQRNQVIELPEFMMRDNPRGRYVGLYIMCLKRISLAVLMELAALSDIRHINKIKAAFEDLDTLEESVEKSLKDFPPSYTLVQGVRCKHQKGAMQGQDQSRQTHNLLTYDGVTCMASCSCVALPPLKETDRTFVKATQKVHHAFMGDKKLSKVVLRDCHGCLYCHKSFGREVYMQRFHNLRVHADFMHGLEKEVTKRCNEDMDLNVL